MRYGLCIFVRNILAKATLSPAQLLSGSPVGDNNLSLSGGCSDRGPHIVVSQGTFAGIPLCWEGENPQELLLGRIAAVGILPLLPRRHLRACGVCVCLRTDFWQLLVTGRLQPFFAEICQQWWFRGVAVTFFTLWMVDSTIMSCLRLHAT